MEKYIKGRAQNVLLKAVLIAGIFAFVLALAGCTDKSSFTEENGKLNVITTIFPYYDFVREIAGDKVNLELVVPAGMDTHSFEPVATDMINFSKADIIIYNGGEMEGWTDEVLKASGNDKIISAKMMDYVDIVTEETVEGMQGERGHSDVNETMHEEQEHAGSAETEEEYDEHIWTSPANASIIVLKIADILSGADKKNSAYYHKNAEKYNKKLKEVDNCFREITKSAEKKYLVFADRFPLRYFTDEYGLGYSAAFAGCSQETEPSADTIAFLIDKIKEENIPVILKIELTSRKVADAISEETGAEVLTFNTCHNITKKQFDKGEGYYSLMKGNVEVLRKALQQQTAGTCVE